MFEVRIVPEKGNPECKGIIGVENITKAYNIYADELKIPEGEREIGLKRLLSEWSSVQEAASMAPNSVGKVFFIENNGAVA